MSGQVTKYHSVRTPGIRLLSVSVLWGPILIMIYQIGTLNSEEQSFHLLVSPVREQWKEKASLPFLYPSTFCTTSSLRRKGEKLLSKLNPFFKFDRHQISDLRSQIWPTSFPVDLHNTSFYLCAARHLQPIKAVSYSPPEARKRCIAQAHKPNITPQHG